MNDYFIFGSVDTRDFGVDVFCQNHETAIPMTYVSQSLAGVSGDILIPDNRYPNRSIVYDVLATSNANTVMNRLQNALLSQVGYQRLVDSFDTDVYMMAAITDSFHIDFTQDHVQGKAKIAFNRMPQRYLLSPESYSMSGGTGNFYRPQYCYFNSKPLIKIFMESSTDTGPTRINMYCFSDNSNYDYYQIVIDDQIFGAGMPDITTTGVNIDCETMEVYGGEPAVNLKPHVTLADQNLSVQQLSSGVNDLHFPMLADFNRFTIQSGSPDTVNEIVVYPRWWKL